MKGVAEVKGWNRQALPTSRLGQFTLVLSRPAVSKRRAAGNPAGWWPARGVHQTHVCCTPLGSGGGMHFTDLEPLPTC